MLLEMFFTHFLLSLRRGTDKTAMSLPIRDPLNVFGSNKQYLLIGNRMKLENGPKRWKLSLWNRFDYFDYYDYYDYYDDDAAMTMKR